MRSWIVAATWLGLLFAASSLQAQRPLSIAVAGGVSLPEGDVSDGVDTGWHALGTIALSTLMQPIGLRLDAAYNRFALASGIGADGQFTVASATLNGTYRLPLTDSPMSPYLISGLGAYRSACSLDSGCEGTIRYGWNVGLGAKLFMLGSRSFVEARYHRTARAEANVNYFPVTFGVVF
jgi:hypothetical protein